MGGFKENVSFDYKIRELKHKTSNEVFDLGMQLQ